MTDNQRIALNMTAQYTRSIVNVLLSLYATRLLLQALGVVDFGIFSVTAGVITLLSFITNALVTTTQRYLSYYSHQAESGRLRMVFASSMLLHIVIGAGLLVILLSLTHPVTRHLLLIAPERLHAATWVYVFVAVTLLLNFLCAPFRAAFVAHENIVYISIVDVLDATFRMLIAVLLLHCSTDRLILYAILLSCISVADILVIGGYAMYRYPETRAISPRYATRETLQDICMFIGWSIYSFGCILLRTQGLAVIINRTFGTIANAAYGISQQVFNSVHFLYSAIVNAMNPGLMRAEGEGHHERMLSIALLECKTAYLIMLAVCVPLIAEMPSVLRIWLGEVPAYAVVLCRMTLLGCLIDQLTLGLNSANQASGKIASYSLLVNTTKALTIPLAALIAHFDASLEIGDYRISTFGLIILTFLGIEALCMLLRIPHLHYSAGLSIRTYLQRVALPVVLPSMFVVAAAWGMHYCFSPSTVRLLATLATCSLVWLVATWFTAMNREERNNILTLFHRA